MDIQNRVAMLRRLKEIQDAKQAPEPEERSEYSALESAGMGAAQGSTFGFADEIQGGVDALLSKTGNLFVPEGGQNPYEDQPIAEVYKQGRDEARSEFKQAEAENPKSFFGGALAAGVAIPGGSLKTLAAQGAATGLGTTESESLGGQVADTAWGGVLGAAGSKVGDLLGKGVSAAKTSKPAQWIATKSASLLGDMPDDFSKKLIENPHLRDPKSFEKISDEVVGAANGLRREIGEFDTRAWGTLSTKPAITSSALKTQVVDSMKEAGVLRELADGTVTSGQMGQEKLAIKKAQEILRELDNHKTLSEQDIKTLIQKIDRETNWDKDEFEVANNLLMGIRSRLDEGLKANPAYKQAMGPVAEKVQALDNLRKNFRLTKDGGDGFAATDTTLNKLKTLSDDTAKSQTMKPNAQKAVEAANPQILEDLETNRIFRTANQDITRGSKSTTGGTIAGASLGAMVGGPALAPVGAAAGWLAGAARDRYGRKAATEGLKKIAPVASGIDDAIQKATGFTAEKWNQIPTKYRTILEKASQQGGRSLAITHFLLSNEDEEYQKATKP